MASITAVRVDRKLHRALKIPMLKFKTFKLTKNSHAAVKKIETEFTLPTSQLDINLINFEGRRNCCLPASVESHDTVQDVQYSARLGLAAKLNFVNTSAAEIGSVFHF